MITTRPANDMGAGVSVTGGSALALSSTPIQLTSSTDCGCSGSLVKSVILAHSRCTNAGVNVPSVLNTQPCDRSQRNLAT